VQGTNGKVVEIVVKHNGQGTDAVVEHFSRKALEALESLNWKRYGVVDRPILSHVDIIVKNQVFNAYGRDILTHLTNILHD
jgi:hypothetical protein